jgi:uncharacterized protein (UPF0276 family)
MYDWCPNPIPLITNLHLAFCMDTAEQYVLVNPFTNEILKYTADNCKERKEKIKIQ